MPLIYCSRYEILKNPLHFHDGDWHQEFWGVFFSNTVPRTIDHVCQRPLIWLKLNVQMRGGGSLSSSSLSPPSIKQRSHCVGWVMAAFPSRVSADSSVSVALLSRLSTAHGISEAATSDNSYFLFAKNKGILESQRGPLKSAVKPK